AGRRKQCAAADRALSEAGEDHLIADGITEADHQDEAGASEEEDGREERTVAREAADTPPGRHREEGQQIETRPEEEIAAPYFRAPHHEMRLQQAELLGSKQPDGVPIAQPFLQAGEAASTADLGFRNADARQRAHVGKIAADVIDLARDELALGWIG